MVEHLTAWIETGRLIDAIFVLLIVECAVLVIIGRRIGLARPVVAVTSVLLPGVFLMLAIRFALTDAAPLAVAGALLAALVAHVWDVALRLIVPLS